MQTTTQSTGTRWAITMVLPRSDGAGEKSVRARKVNSIFSTNFPFVSDWSRTFCHSVSSSPNTFQFG